MTRKFYFLAIALCMVVGPGVSLGDVTGKYDKNRGHTRYYHSVKSFEKLLNAYHDTYQKETVDVKIEKRKEFAKDNSAAVDAKIEAEEALGSYAKSLDEIQKNVYQTQGKFDALKSDYEQALKTQKQLKEREAFAAKNGYLLRDEDKKALAAASKSVKEGESLKSSLADLKKKQAEATKNKTAAEQVLLGKTAAFQDANKKLLGHLNSKEDRYDDFNAQAHLDTALDSLLNSGELKKLEADNLTNSFENMAKDFEEVVGGNKVTAQMLKESFANRSGLTNTPIGAFVDGQISKAMSNVCEIQNMCAAKNAKEISGINERKKATYDYLQNSSSREPAANAGEQDSGDTTGEDAASR